ncbi:uncharacterized protein [Triticum aestivum]|uniref:uncharacterized protein isoform X2 n=1 Tax=Triticum aestivum TaxID=4565 RepID=UPI001D01E4F2|nr:uncharacterized protein LOC123106288 isoform X2 [Triticum aestivum]
MAREHAAEKISYCGSQSDKSSCDKMTEDLDRDEINEYHSNVNSIHKDYVVWPSLPHIVPLEEGTVEGGENCSVYTVESPSGSPIHDCMSGEKEVSHRQKQKLERVENVAANRMRKRNLEGLLKGEDREKLQAGVKRLAHAAAALADRSFPRGRLLLGDNEGIQIG